MQFESASPNAFGTISAWLKSRVYTTLRGAYGTAFMSALGDLMDEVASRADQAAQARLSEFAPDDALSNHGAERNLERGIGESSSSYRAWLGRAWEHWAAAGTRDSVQIQLGHFLQVEPTLVKVTTIWPFQTGLGVTRVVFPPTGYSTTPQPGWEVHDRDTKHWSRFWIEINAVPPWGFGTRLWNDGGVWDGDVTWDSLATPDQVRQTVSAVNKWKPAHASMAGLKFKTLAGAVYVGAPGLVVGGFTVGGSTATGETANWGPGAGS